MRINRLIALTFGMIGIAVSLSACGDMGTNTNITNANANMRNVNMNSNTAVLVNANSTNRWVNVNGNISRADYDRDRADYERDRGSSTIGQGANDSWLWFKTRAALMTADDLRDSTINVDVVNDVVTLRGTVETAAQKASAMKVARGIQDVKNVVDQLKVAPEDSVTNMSGNSNGNRNSNR